MINSIALVVVGLHGTEPGGPGLRSLERLGRTAHPSRDVVIFSEASQKDSPLMKEYLKVFSGRKVAIAGVPDGSLNSPGETEKVLQSPLVYEVLSRLGYTHCYRHDPSAWMTRDDLDWWADLGYDYVGCPVISSAGAPMFGGIGLGPEPSGSVFNQVTSAGSLIRVTPALRLMSALTELRSRNRNRPDGFRNGHDGFILSGTAFQNWEADMLPKLNVCPRELCLKYGWDFPMTSGADPSLSVQAFCAFSQTTIPMVYRAPDPGLCKELLRQGGAGDPKCIVIPSSAMKPNADIMSVIPAGTDPETILPVFINKAKGLIDNPSGRTLVSSAKRVLTVHNDTVEFPMGYCCCPTVTSYIKTMFGPLVPHDRMLLHYRNTGNCYVSYDGLVKDSAATDALLEFRKEDGGKHVPTAGMMTYRILRRKYPEAEFYLVDFFGRTKGHYVFPAHDTEWEQAEYAKDPKVHMVFT